MIWPFRALRAQLLGLALTEGLGRIFGICARLDQDKFVRFISIPSHLIFAAFDLPPSSRASLK
jgi:hypothetical protein